MKYELCYLVGESKEQELSRIKEEVLNLVSQDGGKWFEPQIEEKRKTAYKVGKETRGIYITQQFEIVKEDSESDEMKNPIDSITRKLNLYHDVLRFIIVKADEVPELKVKEIKETVKKDFRKQTFVKKSEPVVEKEKEVAEKKIEAPVEEVKESADTKAAADEGKSKEAKKEEKEEKSIDDKINEILNI